MVLRRSDSELSEILHLEVDSIHCTQKKLVKEAEKTIEEHGSKIMISLGDSAKNSRRYD